MAKLRRAARSLAGLLVTAAPAWAWAAPPGEPFGPPPPPELHADAEHVPNRPATHAPARGPKPPAAPRHEQVSVPPARPQAAACDEISAIRELRAEVAALRGQLPDPERQAALAAERAALQEKLDALDHAIREGVDPSLLEAPRSELTARMAELDRRIAETPQPSGMLGLEASVSRLEGSLAAMRLDVKSRMPAPDRGERVASAPTSPTGADTATSGGEKKDDGAEPIGVEIALGLASMYQLRGVNAFRATSQLDPHVLVAPSVTYAHESGFSASYWGAYQASGSNREANVKAGIGNEQDVTIAFKREIAPSLTAGGGLLTTAYPFADEAVAGTEVPLYLEPFVMASYETAVDLGLYAAYSRGVQEEVGPASYVYLMPSVGKTFEVTPAAGIGLGSAFGTKIRTDPGAPSDNRFDVRLDGSVHLHPTATTHVTPGVHYGWTDLDGVPFSGEQTVWASLDTGIAL